MTSFDDVLLGIGVRLLRSPPGAMIVRGLQRSLARLVPYTPRRADISPERARARVAVEIRPSGITGAGLGLFAAERVPADFVIGEYAGDTIDSIFKVLRMRNLGYLAIDEPCVDTAGHPEVAMRYICHHPRPERQNVDFVSDDGQIFIRTTRAVEAGEEFFLDYGYMYWAIHGVTPGSDPVP
jgi:hypothetical protein